MTLLVYSFMMMAVSYFLDKALGNVNLTALLAPVRHSTRPLANPDLFKPTPPVPKSDGRKVSFQNGPPEEIDIYRSSPQMGAKDSQPQTSGKPSKWQPLSTIDPSPIGENENDPFSLGDSEDEKELRDRTAAGKEMHPEEVERLKKATAEAMAEGIDESGTSGTNPGKPATDP